MHSFNKSLLLISVLMLRIAVCARQAQAHAQVAQDLAAQKLAEGKFHAQEAARISKEKAAELASNVSTLLQCSVQHI